LDLADLRYDDVPDRVVGVRLDLRDEVVLAEQGIELDDVLDLDQLLIDLLLPGRFDVDEDEADGRGDPLF